MYTGIYVTGSAKTIPICTRTETNLMPNINDALMHHPETSSTCP